jgi:hypothetical protein
LKISRFFENNIISIKVVKALCVGLMPEAKGMMTRIKAYGGGSYMVKKEEDEF